jgi:hypothetical protein
MQWVFMCVGMSEMMDNTELTFYNVLLFSRDDMNILWWQIFYDAMDQYNLHQWWNSRWSLSEDVDSWKPDQHHMLKTF